MSEAVVTVIGRLTADPTWGHTKNRDVFANFDVAVNHGYYDREHQQYVETGASFFSVSAFRNLAINSVESLKKGTPVVVQGRLRLVKWENGEKQGTTARIEALAVGPDLTWGQADFVAVKRPRLAGDDPMDDPNVTQSMPGEHQEAESGHPGEQPEQEPHDLANSPAEPPEDDYGEDIEALSA